MPRFILLQGEAARKDLSNVTAVNDTGTTYVAKTDLSNVEQIADGSIVANKDLSNTNNISNTFKNNLFGIGNAADGTKAATRDLGNVAQLTQADVDRIMPAGMDYVVRRDIVDATHNPDLQQYYGENVVLERTKDGYITIYEAKRLTFNREGHKGEGSYVIMDTNKGFGKIYAFASKFDSKDKENYTIILAANANSGSDYEAPGVSVSFVKSVNGSIGFL
jgi:hypothetical protein